MTKQELTKFGTPPTSAYEGVFVDKHATPKTRYRAAINFKPKIGNSKKYALGSYPTGEEAAEAYQFARATNLFPRRFLLEKLRKAEDIVIWCTMQLELTDAYLGAIEDAQTFEESELDGTGDVSIE